MPEYRPEFPQEPEEKAPEANPYSASIGRAAVDKQWRKVLEDTFELPLRLIAKAAQIAHQAKITVAEAIERVKRENEETKQ